MNEKVEEKVERFYYRLFMSEPPEHDGMLFWGMKGTTLREQPEIKEFFEKHPKAAISLETVRFFRGTIDEAKHYLDQLVDDDSSEASMEAFGQEQKARMPDSGQAAIYLGDNVIASFVAIGFELMNGRVRLGLKLDEREFSVGFAPFDGVVNRVKVLLRDRRPNTVAVYLTLWTEWPGVEVLGEEDGPAPDGAAEVTPR